MRLPSVRRWRILLATSGVAIVGIAAQAQTPDPFVRPPPTQAPSQNPAPGLPPSAASPQITIDMLVKQGFEVRGMERTSDKSADFVVILQRSGDIRTCLMRIARDANRQLKRDSHCF